MTGLLCGVEEVRMESARIKTWSKVETFSSKDGFFILVGMSLSSALHCVKRHKCALKAVKTLFSQLDSIISEEFLHEKFELLFHLRDFCPCVLFSELFSLVTHLRWMRMN